MTKCFFPKWAVYSISLVSLVACIGVGEEETQDQGDTDRQAPTNTRIVVNNDTETTTSRSVTLILSATDDTGISAYIVSEVSDTPASDSDLWMPVEDTKSLNLNVPFVFSAETQPGTYPKTVYAWYKDATGNISDRVSDQISLNISDVNHPLSKGILINAGAASTESVNVTIQLTAIDDTGVTAYFLTESSALPSVSSTAWIPIASTNNLNIDTSFILSTQSSTGDYTKTIYAWFRDDAGNISESVSDSITLHVFDIVAPYSISILINAGDVTTTSANVSLSLSASDNVGVTHYFLSETSTIPNMTDNTWVTLANPTAVYDTTVAFTLSPATGTRTIYTWFRDTQGNLSSPASDTISLIMPSATDVGINWMFFGDSETDGRANELSAVSPVVAFTNIWNQSYNSSIVPFIDGVGGTDLRGSRDRYRATANRDSASWVHFQESGIQNAIEDTPEEYVVLFESMIRSIVRDSPDAIISLETAYSFEAEAGAGSDWSQHNIYMLAKIDALHAEGINIYVAEVDRNIKELVKRKRTELGTDLGQREVWGDTNNDIGRHYTGLGNLMVALSLFDSLGYDVGGLDLGDIPNIEISIADKQLCVDIINYFH